MSDKIPALPARPHFPCIRRKGLWWLDETPVYDHMDAQDARIKELEGKLADVMWLYECDKCCFIANPEHSGNSCRCGGKVIRKALSPEGERSIVMWSNEASKHQSRVAELEREIREADDLLGQVVWMAENVWNLETLTIDACKEFLARNAEKEQAS